MYNFYKKYIKEKEKNKVAAAALTGMADEQSVAAALGRAAITRPAAGASPPRSLWARACSHRSLPSRFLWAQACLHPS